MSTSSNSGDKRLHEILEEIVKHVKRSDMKREENKKIVEKYYERLFSKPYEISITFPKNVLKFVDEMADKENLSREEWILKELERKRKQDVEKKEWKDILSKYKEKNLNEIENILRTRK